MNRCAFSPWPHISSDTPLDAWVCEAYQAQISQLCAALLQTVCVRSWQASRTVGDVGCRPGSQGNTASREPIGNRYRAAAGIVISSRRGGLEEGVAEHAVRFGGSFEVVDA